MLEKGLLKDNESPETIHRAQLAKLKIRTRSQPDWRSRRRSDAMSPYISRSQSRAPSQPTIPEEAPMEQDFTEIKTPGDLGCPFAPKSAQKLGEQSTIASTPRDAQSIQGSALMESGPRSKRPSFVDPIRPDIKQSPILSPAESLNESTSVACPIRFLEQHSPEDVAKYFEEHKHELPRSHEVCVKRFQSADSAREIDAKYGGIVTMIQGLGKKHKPMLPEVPNAETVADASEEQQAKRRVKNWAASVSKFQDEAEHDDEDTPPQEQVDADIEDDRVTRFDRDLDDVRVGESPSRPWGVTVPRAADNVSVTSSTPVAGRDNSPSRDKKRDTLPSAQDDRVLAAIRANRLHGKPIQASSAKNNGSESVERPSGKCPFDNGALNIHNPTQGNVAHNDSAVAITPEASEQPQAKCPFDHKALNVPASAVIQGEPSSSTFAIDTASRNAAAAPSNGAEASIPEPAMRGPAKLINYGTAVVADGSQLPVEGFVNRGVLLLGYDAASARGLLAAAPAPHAHV